MSRKIAEIVFLFVAATFSIEDLRTAECATACKYLSYDSGYYAKNFCYCVDKKDYKEIVDVKIISLGKKIKDRPDYWRD